GGGNGGSGGGAAGTGGGGGGGGTTTESTGGTGGSGGTIGGGGGGGGGGNTIGGNAGTGGFGSGGGGGGSSANLGVGPSFGVGGSAGFGGGTGGNGILASPPGSSVGGGGGGGGAAFGGALVAFNGSSLTVADGSFSNNQAIAGPGGAGGTSAENGTSGIGFGQDIFLQSGSAATFNVSGTLILLNPIQSDTGTPGAPVSKIGAGTLKLNGANTYTGGTTISGGILNLNGSVIGPVVVGINCTFSGNGTINTSGSSVGNLTNSGTVFPGNSIGAIFVAGNYTQNAGGTLDIELSPSGNNSLLSISGTATLNGTVDFIMEPGTYISGTTYTFLTASGGVINQFSNVVFNQPNVDASVIYGPTFVQLLLRSMGPFVPVGFPPLFRPGLDPNPRAVAKYLDGFTMTPGSDLFNIFTILESLSLNALNCALNQMQPSLFGGGFSITEQENSIMVRSALSRRMALLHDTGCCEAILKNRKVGLWADVFGGYIHQGHLHDNSRFHASSVGVAGGIDYLFLETLSIGAFGGFVDSDIDWTEDCALADGDIDSGYGGIYATWYPNLFFLNASAFGASNDYKGTRKIQFSTIDRRAKHHQDGSEFAANLNFGVNVPLGLGFFQPFANFDYVYLHQEGYTEHGAPTFNLKVRSKNTNLLRSQIGFKRTVCFHFDWGSLVPDVALSWARESRFGSRKYKAGFKNFINTHGFFTVQIGKPSRNLFVSNVGLTGEFFGGRLAVGGSYDAAIGRHFSENIFSGRIDLKF
ncbi:MAG TPA: autotransporter domain-containing protein, partial [Rhabdochlamydiaceae bacterium]|nr:autotransporter domain-containing protein [Rhabdochlamydiaceae bacterium]